MNLATSKPDALFNFVKEESTSKELLPDLNDPSTTSPLHDVGLTREQLANENWDPLSREEVEKFDNLCSELTFNLDTSRLCNYTRYNKTICALRVLWAQTEECIIFHDSFFSFTHLIKRQVARQLSNEQLSNLLNCMNAKSMVDLEIIGPNSCALKTRVVKRAFQVQRHWRIDRIPEIRFIDMKTTIDAFLPDNGGPSPGHPNRAPPKFTDYTFHGNRVGHGSETFHSLTLAERYANIICKRLTTSCRSHGLGFASLFNNRFPRFRSIIWEKFVAVEDHLHPYTHFIPIRTFFDSNFNIVAAIDCLQYINPTLQGRESFEEWLQNRMEPNIEGLSLPFNALLHVKTPLGDFSLPETRNACSPMVRDMLNNVTLCLNERHKISGNFARHPTANRFSYRMDGTSIYVLDCTTRKLREISNAERALHWSKVYLALVDFFKPWGTPFQTPFNVSEDNTAEDDPPSPVIFARFESESLSSEDQEI